MAWIIVSPNISPAKMRPVEKTDESASSCPSKTVSGELYLISANSPFRLFRKVYYFVGVYATLMTGLFQKKN